MKKKVIFLFLIVLSFDGFSQIDLNKIKKGVKKVENLNEKSKKSDVEKNNEENNTNNSEIKEDNENGQKTDTNDAEEGLILWSKFDFVPGNTVIFEDNQEGEEHGEFPSKWDLAEGNAEISKFGNMDVIQLVDRKTTIIPLVKEKDFLPEVFTIEYDLYTSESSPFYYIYLWDRKQQLKNSGSVQTTDLIKIGKDKTTMGDYFGDYKKFKEKSWQHISIAFNKRSLKLYVNETRVLNIPNLEFLPKSFTLATGASTGKETDIWLIKNIRVAEGGKNLYSQIPTDGKIVTNGILFDIGKSTIKPQSMGIINSIYKMLQNDQELNFEIVGHTDNTGDEESNLSLSKKRAEAVMIKLKEMGITSDRMKYEGKGESQPVNDNSTPEGRAMNRRVEFIKF